MHKIQREVTIEFFFFDLSFHSKMSFQSKHEFVNSNLVAKFRKEIESEDKASNEIEFKRTLQKVPIPKDEEKIKRENEKYPLNSRAISIWDIHLHPQREFKLTFDFTKLDRVYFGQSQYR